MDRNDEEREHDSGFDSLEDATGMEDRNAQPAMPSGKELAADEEEPTGDEKTAVEGASGVGATNLAWGGMPTDIQGGAGTDVPAEGDEPPAEKEEAGERTDPRGY